MGSIPIRGAEVRVGWALASPPGCNPDAMAVQVQLLPDALTRPVRLSARTPAPQAGKRGSIPLRATEPRPTAGAYKLCGFKSHSRQTRDSQTVKAQTLGVCKDSSRDLCGFMAKWWN